MDWKNIFKSSFVYGFTGGVLGALLMVWLLGFGAKGNVGDVINTHQNITLKEDSAIIDAVAKISPAVVSIISSRNVQTFWGGNFEQKSGGTGFVIRQNGLIATNRHVVSEDAEYTAITSDGSVYAAEVLAKDPLNDLAIIKINAKDLPIVDLGDSDSLEVGQRVVAIGNALGEYQNTVTAGIVSAMNRVIVAGDSSGSQSERLDGVIQTDAGINPGNSGGPLVNMAGQVIGINTAIDLQGREIGFAIPINSVKSAIESVLTTGSIKRPMLGIRYINITKEFASLNKMSIEKGALVTRGNNPSELAVSPGGPADLAGIKENDIIVSIDNQEINNDHSIISILCEYQPGDVIKVKLLRAANELEVSVKLGELSS